MKYRLKYFLIPVEHKDYEVIGEPETISGARQLAKDDRYQFQWWSLSLVQAKPLGGDAGTKEGKRGADRGIDGIINFVDENNKTQRVLVQVKSGHVKVAMFVTWLALSSEKMVQLACSLRWKNHLEKWSQKRYPLAITTLVSGRKTIHEFRF